MNRVESIHIDGVVAVCTLAAILLCALFTGLISAASSNGKRFLPRCRNHPALTAAVTRVLASERFCWCWK